MAEGRGGIQDVSMFIEMLWTGDDLQLGELREVGVPDVALEGKRGAAAFALDVDQPGVRQLLEVVGDRGGAEHLLLGKRTAGCGVLAGNLLQDGGARGCGCR